jgi:16S rRNA (guanine527-N7)-methyltransferase
VVAAAVPESCRIADVGSGAGLPGLVIAILRPDTEVTLIEPLLRRIGFLEECITSLGLGHVQVRRARAQECAELFGSFDVVAARAVAPLDRLIDWTMPLLRPGGRLLALKGVRAEEEVELAGPRLDRADVGKVTVRRYGQGIVDVPTTVVEIRSADRRPPVAGTRRPADNVSRETRS